MQKKILLISDAIDAPFDEGIKNIVYSLSKQLVARDNVVIIVKNGSETNDINAEKTDLDKLFLNLHLKYLLKKYTPDIILYIPIASCSFYSFIRAKMLKLMKNEAKVVLLCVQHREYSSFQRLIIKRFLRSDLVLLLGKCDESCFSNMNMKTRILPPAIDTEMFYPSVENEKNAIRSSYGIPLDKRIVLHVGHIKPDRNLESLIDVQMLDDTQVIVVGSTSVDIGGFDYSLKKRLEDTGIIVISDFIRDIAEIYRMSDIYVFPVIDKTAAIEMPLSVLEAMACNLPIISTRYGGLVDFFTEDAGFKYFDTPKKLMEIIRDIGNENEISNYKKVESFTWKRFADEVLSACENL